MMNDEIRMTNDERTSKAEAKLSMSVSTFGFLSSFVIRILSFLLPYPVSRGCGCPSSRIPCNESP
jgi:hypothetical protein